MVVPGGWRFLHKPFGIQELFDAIHGLGIPTNAPAQSTTQKRLSARAAGATV
jgi:hypothetical protein